jgi:hypothetical protein
VRGPRQPQVDGSVALEAPQQEPRPAPVEPLDLRGDIRRLFESEGNPTRVEVHRTEELGVGIVSVHDRRAARHDRTEQPSLGPAPRHKDVGALPRHGPELGDYGRVEQEPLGAPAFQIRGGNLDYASGAAVLDHRGEHCR